MLSAVLGPFQMKLRVETPPDRRLLEPLNPEDRRAGEDGEAGATSFLEAIINSTPELAEVQSRAEARYCLPANIIPGLESSRAGQELSQLQTTVFGLEGSTQCYVFSLRYEHALGSPRALKCACIWEYRVKNCDIKMNL